MEPIFLTCMVIAYFFTKGKVDTAAYASGKESPGVAKARMRHEGGGGGRSASGRPKGKGAFRLMLADRWANACEASRQRGEHKAKRRRAWYDETAPLKDEKWREKKLQRLRNAETARNRWARDRGLIDLSEFRDRKAEEEAWKENERRNAEAAAAASTDPAAAPAATGTDETDSAKPTDPATPETKPTDPAEGTDEDTKADPAEAAKAEEPAAAGTDPAPVEAGTGEDAKTDKPAEAPATAETPATNGTEGTTNVYEQAVTRLIAEADVVAEYRSDLAAFADTLDGKKWGTEVTGPIKDMDGQLAAIEGDYRDLAGQMKHQGDQGAAAHEQAPWVPADDSILV